MYFLPNKNPHEIGDFEIVTHQDRLHLFYLSLPSHDLVGHLVSDDGLNWQQLPHALRTGNPGEFDDDQIWTMGMFELRGKWFMLYTSNQKGGRVQVVGLATSDDLIHWTKHDKNPVACADPRWYEATQTGNYRVDWRDPHITFHDGKLHAFICARENQGPLNHRGCAGYFTSTDGYRWEIQPPACTPRNSYDFECPSVFELNGRYYMVAMPGGHNRTIYRIADRIEGPYRRPIDDSLTPGLNMSVRPCMFRGELHLFHWNRGPVDWTNAYSSYACVSSPKVVRADAQGQLQLESFDWSAQASAAAEKMNSETPTAITTGQWHWQNQQWHGSSDFGTGIALLQNCPMDFEITVDVQTDACEFGVVLRSEREGDCGLFARCIPGRSCVELVKQFYNRRHGPESLWRGRKVLQNYHFTPSPQGTYRLRLIAWGPNVEFNVNGRLVLSELSLPTRHGQLGLFVEDGRAIFSNLLIRPLRPPTSNWGG
jgi:beta-fructofuranosidase